MPAVGAAVVPSRPKVAVVILRGMAERTRWLRESVRATNDETTRIIVVDNGSE